MIASVLGPRIFRIFGLAFQIGLELTDLGVGGFQQNLANLAFFEYTLGRHTFFN